MYVCTCVLGRSVSDDASLQARDANVDLTPRPSKSPALAEIFHVGQLVRAVIVGLDQQARAGASNSKSGKKIIRLSLQLSKVNAALTPEAVQRNAPLPACVTSVEDHGYTLSFGIKGITGFLSKKSQGSGAAAGLKPGMLIECVAQSQKAKQKTVKVTAAPGAVTDALTEDYPGLSIGKAHLMHRSVMPWLRLHVWSCSVSYCTLGGGHCYSNPTKQVSTIAVHAMPKDAKPLLLWIDCSKRCCSWLLLSGYGLSHNLTASQQ